MSTNPTYIVTPLAGVAHAVRIETTVPTSPYCDESHPVVLQAATPEALPLMQTFLSGLSRNTSWTSRESRGTAHIKEGVMPDGVTDVALSHAMNSRRPGPKEWHSILTGDEDLLLELCVVNETLAHQIFDALLDGSLLLRYADPDPV